jgi:hypothetical protein
MNLLLVLGLLASACGRGDDDDAAASTSAPSGTTSTAVPVVDDPCEGATLEATDVGISADTITIEVLADVGSPLAPGMFQGNVDAIQGFADWVNDNGGIACRELVLRTWDTKLNPEESKNGQLDACASAFAMVGSNALFNPDVTATTDCPDKSGAATGLPDIAALAADANQQCAPTTYVIQPVVQCPLATGVRTFEVQVGMFTYLAEQLGGLHGGYVSSGDLPVVLQGGQMQTAGIAAAGVQIDEFVRISAADEQVAYAPRVLRLKEAGANWVHNGAIDRAGVTLRREAAVQGLDSVQAWTCALACYTKQFIEAGDVVEGTYLYLDWLPFEERDTNEALDAFITELGDKADSFGANSWQAGMAFKEAVDRVVAKDGVNGLTRAALLAELEDFGDFDAGGWLGTKTLRGISPCYVLLQVQGGEYVRVHPK